MATKSAQQEPEKAEVIEELLDTVDTALDRLKVLYEQYFLGIQKQPPTYLHTDVERKLRDVAQLQIRNTALRYRFATLQQKFGSYNSYWRRTLRQIENGTYTRNLFKIGRQAARTGADVPEEILAAMPKRMRDQVKRDREAALALARVREQAVREQPPREAEPASGFEPGSETEPELLTLAEQDVDVDLDDLNPAVIHESPELRRDALSAGGAYRIDEADADFDMDALFSQVAADDTPPTLESLRQAARSRPPSKPAPAVGRTPTGRSEPRPPSSERRGHPRPGTLSGSPIAGRPDDRRLPTSRRASTDPGQLELGPPGAGSRAGTAQPEGRARGAPDIELQAAGPARARTAQPDLGPPEPPAARFAPRARTEQPVAEKPPLPSIRQATQGMPMPRDAGGPRAPSQPAPPAPSQPAPPAPSQPAPSQPTPSMPVAPSVGTRSIPVPPSAGTRSIPVAPPQAPRSIPVAPSQATRSIPVIPGASAARAPEPVESMNGPFPRIPSIPSLPGHLRTPAGGVPIATSRAAESAVPMPVVDRGSAPTAAGKPAESSYNVRIGPQRKPERAATADPARSPAPARPAEPSDERAPSPRPLPAHVPPRQRRASEPRAGLPPGMTDADVNALYAKFVEAKQLLGEEAGPGSYGKLLKTINAQAPKIMEQYKAKGVEFSVAVKGDQVIIRAKPNTTPGRSTGYI